MSSSIPNAERLLAHIRELHAQIRNAVVAAFERHVIEDLARVDADDAGDTIYAVDRVSEATLIDFFARYVAPEWPLVLIGEGLPGGCTLLPTGISEDEARIRVIVDPIDGTRGLMYQKRSAWILTGVAPNRGPQTSLRDIELAVQSEIPLLKQHLCDSMWVLGDQPAQAERFNRLSGERRPLHLRPSRATTIAHGFAMISRFFPGGRADLAAIDDELARALIGPPQAGKAACFEDQYISSAGQLYELIAGHDRFVADLRPLLEPLLHARGDVLGICCHPYDLCTVAIARAYGVIISDARGAELDAPLDIHGDVDWVGYANAELRTTIEPVLQHILHEHGLL
jgi:hypothetical protein